MLRPACAWRGACSAGLSSSTQNGVRPESSSRSDHALESIPGYCNVGNFGSADRMDYTIIGAEANLAARLQSIAEPGGIVISYETFALVSDVITSHPLPPITMKGISREVIPYSVDSMIDTSTDKGGVVIERMPGLDFYLDPAIVKSADTERIRSVLLNALSSLDKRRVNSAV